MEKPQEARTDLKKKCEEAAGEFYKAGMKHIAALDGWIEAEKGLSVPGDQLTSLRQRMRMMKTSLHRLFPNESADTGVSAE
jgi:hypothetical protein